MKISVVIPVYNVKQYLDRCIASLAGQTYSDWEMILVDDGSTDGSGQLCDCFAAKLPRTQVIHRENGGLGMARNSGMAEASGEYVLFLDPDDYYGPDLLKNLSEAAERSGADLVIGGHTIVGPDGGTRPCPAPCEQVFHTPEEMARLLLDTVGTQPGEQLDSKYGVSACGRLYRRLVIQRGGLQFVSERRVISEDLIFNMDFLRWADSAIATTDASYFYCTNNSSLSKRHREDRFAQDCVLYQAVEERLERWYPGDAKRFRLPLARLLIGRARYDIVQEVDYRDFVDRAYPLREKVGEIVSNRKLRGALDGYPWWKMPWMQAVFSGFLAFRQVWALLVLVRLRRRFCSAK